MEGDRGAGARGNRGWRGREAGEQEAGSGIKHKEGSSLLFITGYYSVKKLM